MKHLTGLLLSLSWLVLAGCSSQSGGLASAEPSPAASAPDNAKVTVYYFHRTMRCISCLTIEKMARETLEQTSAQELAQGTIRWRAVDYWRDKALAECFGVEMPVLVVAVHSGGKIASFRRLDETWALKGNPPAFREMLVAAVKEAMQKQPA